MVNEWTRDDLPDATELCRMSVYNIDVMVDRNLNAIVGHLNANHPKSDTDRWRRAHEIVERERDQARESLHEACKVAQSYKVDAYQATERAEAAERELDEWKSRAEAAEARTAPAVTRAGVKNAIDTCFALAPKINTQVISDAVCDFLGVEAEPADPLLDKAQEFAALADWELTDREAELLHTVAAHVLGQEDRHVDQ